MAAQHKGSSQWTGPSIYCEATTQPEDVIYYGSDDEDYDSPEARRQRIEVAGRRFLAGRSINLLSASLSGPFDKSSGWTNPWRSKLRTHELNHPSSSKTRTQAKQTPTKQSKTIRRHQPEQQECHLPSPVSLKQVSPARAQRRLEKAELQKVRGWKSAVELQSEQSSSDTAAPRNVNRKRRASSTDWLKTRPSKRARSNEASPTGLPSPSNRSHSRRTRTTNDPPQVNPSASFESAPGRLGHDHTQSDDSEAEDELLEASTPPVWKATPRATPSKRSSPWLSLYRVSENTKDSDDELSLKQANLSVSPSSGKLSITKEAIAPMKKAVSPIKQAEFPLKHTESPLMRTRSVSKHAETPTKKVESQMKEARSPLKTERATFLEVKSSPAKGLATSAIDKNPVSPLRAFATPPANLRPELDDESETSPDDESTEAEKYDNDKTCGPSNEHNKLKALAKACESAMSSAPSEPSPKPCDEEEQMQGLDEGMSDSPQSRKSVATENVISCNEIDMPDHGGMEVEEVVEQAALQDNSNEEVSSLGQNEDMDDNTAESQLLSEAGHLDDPESDSVTPTAEVSSMEIDLDAAIPETQIPQDEPVPMVKETPLATSQAPTDIWAFDEDDSLSEYTPAPRHTRLRRPEAPMVRSNFDKDGFRTPARPRRDTTPEPTFTVKNFAMFMSPSPKRPRQVWQADFSYFSSPCRTKVSNARRVSWAPLPHEVGASPSDVLADAPSSRARQASPPPPVAVAELPTGETDLFRHHFAAVTKQTHRARTSPRPSLTPCEAEALPASQTRIASSKQRHTAADHSQNDQENQPDPDESSLADLLQMSPRDLVDELFEDMRGAGFLASFDVDKELDQARRVGADSVGVSMDVGV